MSPICSKGADVRHGEPDLARERVIFTKEGIEQVRGQ
jgi:hypothetical protein